MNEYMFILRTEYEELKKYKLKCEGLLRQIERMDRAFTEQTRGKKNT